jgi:hypothetical protein
MNKSRDPTGTPALSHPILGVLGGDALPLVALPLPATLGSEFATTGFLARAATDLLTGLTAPAEYPSPFFAPPAIKLSKPSLRRAGGEEAQRGGHQSRTSQLYSPTARDFAAGEPPRHLVEGFLVGEKANLSSIVPLHQQRYSSYPFFPAVTNSVQPQAFSLALGLASGVTLTSTPQLEKTIAEDPYYKQYHG